MTRLDALAVSALISVAIERQSEAPGGMDAIAYAVLRDAQRMLRQAAEEASGVDGAARDSSAAEDRPVRSASPRPSASSGSGSRG